MITTDQADAMLEQVPPAIRPIRERQMAAARIQGVALLFNDSVAVSQTAIRGIPLDLTGIPIYSDDQLTALVETVHPLFGFENKERLILSGPSGNGYIFHQTINGIPVESKLVNVVLGADRTISAIRGNAILDRGFRVDHPLDAAAAIRLVDEYLEQEFTTAPRGNSDTANARLVYKHWGDARSLAPWWLVEKAGHVGYYVDPDGAVSSAVMVTP